MSLIVPTLSLVVLVGASGSGKSTFARNHFRSTEVLSSDAFRAMVADDENDQSATPDAFAALHFVAAKRLAAGRLTVIDATNVQVTARRPLVELAREHDVLPVAIVFDLPERLSLDRNRTRTDRDIPERAVRQQVQQLQRSIRGLRREGFRYVHVLRSVEEVDAATIDRQRPWNDRSDERGPFDLIGDVHGCADELLQLLDQLDYRLEHDTSAPLPHTYRVSHPSGRKAVFLGDLVDRGPATPTVLGIVMSMVEAGCALAVPGNHDDKLLRSLRGRPVQVTHGLAESLEQLAQEPSAFREKVIEFLDGLIGHYVLDGGKLVVAHAGVKEPYQGRTSARVRDFALYGETTGETDEFGLPVRQDWAADYRGQATVVYGHTPVPQATWVNRTIDIDTGCVFGGQLTALRYPERELISVAAARVYYEPVKPLTGRVDQQRSTLPSLDDVTGKRVIPTRLRGNVTVPEEHAAAALEVMSRFAVDPHWLIYLPPTMSPAETAPSGPLEHPREAFSYFKRSGVAEVICEEKHMGSRAVIVAGRSPEAIRSRFGVTTGESGIAVTRTGRRFFAEQDLEQGFIEALCEAIGSAGLWDALETEWVCLDAEILPWSLKAEELIFRQYAAVGAAGSRALGATSAVLAATAARVPELATLLAATTQRTDAMSRYVEAYRRYCWPVRGLEDVRVAPFHVLATEGAAHVERPHDWHMEWADRLAKAAPDLVRQTATTRVQVGDESSEAAATAWWEDLTGRGGEGMVVKPLEFLVRGKRGLVQPGIKVRGADYLRIIYGPDYDAPQNLDRLRKRSLNTKRSLAEREFALGVEALERFVAAEPLWRVHECVFGVLALESEPVDPRL